MAEPEKKERTYKITQIDEEKQQAEPEEPDRLPEDPLDHLPEMTSSGIMPIVVFVLVCLTAFAVMMAGQLMTADSVRFIVGYVAIIAVMLFGIAALMRGMTARQRRQQKPVGSTVAVMVVAIVVGAALGVMFLMT